MSMDPGAMGIATGGAVLADDSARVEIPDFLLKEKSDLKGALADPKTIQDPSATFDPFEAFQFMNQKLAALEIKVANNMVPRAEYNKFRDEMWKTVHALQAEIKQLADIKNQLLYLSGLVDGIKSRR